MKQLYRPFSAGRVRLRLLEEADLPATLAWRNRDGVRQQFKSSAELAWEQHVGWFQRYREKPDDFVFIVEEVASGARVGQVAVYGIDKGRGDAEIGRFVVAPEYQGKGWMREAILALVRFAANTIGVRSVYLEVRETNERARRLYRSIGFAETDSADGMIRMERGTDVDI
jgi:RimJ/RimL family protein N-acetyltransferase